MSSKIKNKLKSIYIKLNPTYKKLDAIQKQLNRISGRFDDLIKFQARNQNMLWMLQKEEPKTLKETQRLFWRNYPKADGDMRILQTGNMFVLKAMKEICSENGLTFWLHGGTLIGAIRHGGCIPWDDDVDVAMTRADLEKFAEVCKNNPDYELNFYYHDDNTFSRAYQFKRRNQEIPCFIDIFVFDYYSGTYPEDNAEFKKVFAIERGAMVSEYMGLSKRPVVEDIGCHHFGPFNAKNKEIADEIIDRHIDNIGDRYNGKSLYYSIENYPFPYPLFPVDKIFPTQKCMFEGIECDMPADPDYYLKGYGDYWQMPKDFGTAAHYYYYEPHIKAIEEFCEKNNFSLE